MQHPDEVLFKGEKSFPALPACEHFAGNEKFIRKALTLQMELGLIFDVTCDCEDGAPAGEELEHARKIFDYVLEQGQQVILEKIDQPHSEFSTVHDIFDTALK